MKKSTSMIKKCVTLVRRLGKHPAVTPVIATILVVSIVLSVSAAVLVWGIPYIERTKANAQQSSAYAQFNLFEKTLDSLVNEGPGATKENRFSFAQGTIEAEPNNCRIVTYYSLDQNYNFNLSGLNDDDNQFTLHMVQGKCTGVKIYKYGTTTGYSRFNPEGEVGSITQEPNTPGYYNKTTVYNLSSSDCKAYYTLSGTETPLSGSTTPLSDGNYTPYSQTQLSNAANESGENVWYGNYGDDGHPEGYYVNLVYRFKITQAVLDLSWLNISWLGYDTLAGGGNFSLYIWNCTSNSWENPWYTTSSSSSTSSWHNTSISSNFDDYVYVNSTGKYVFIGLSGAKGVGLPEVVTNAATNVAANTATLNGELQALGNGSSWCKIWFEYGTTTSYGSSTSMQNVTSPTSFSADVSGLAPGTVYHFRAAANSTTDSATTAYG
ncbi:MAG: hypothetical protein DRN01_05870, partial [Thermoplasmata archaeon]